MKTIEQIKKMKRGEIRYAIFRIKAGTGSDDQLDTFSFYEEQLSSFGYDVFDFTSEWDIDKADNTNIVTGRVAKRYNKDTSLFVDGVTKG
jgi:hypothetical protein